MTDFSLALRDASEPDWSAAVRHRFADELFAGRIAEPAMRRYLVQDYQFVDRFVALVGAAIATSDRYESRRRFAAFAAMVTSEENTYFQRAFDRLGVPAAEREAPALRPVTAEFRALLARTAQGGRYLSILAVLTVAEWLYLTWADRPRAALPADFVHAEWITLHNNDGFRDFVGWLRGEFDRVALTADAAEREAARAAFREAVSLERRFFDAVYED